MAARQPEVRIHIVLTVPFDIVGVGGRGPNHNSAASSRSNAMSRGGGVLPDDAVPSGGSITGPRGFLAASRSQGRSRSPFGVMVSVIACPWFGPTAGGLDNAR